MGGSGGSATGDASADGGVVDAGSPDANHEADAATDSNDASIDQSAWQD
jgi:hypothetical protein